MTRLTVAGLGAVGGFIAARLLQAGMPDLQVSALVTPRHLEPLRSNGLTLRCERAGPAGAGEFTTGERTTGEGLASEHTIRVPIAASARAADLGVQDIVVVATKATSLVSIAPAIRPLLGPDTIVVSAMNGIPWWFGAGLDHPALREPLETVDPGGRLATAMAPECVVGCVVHLTASMPEPGVVHHGFGQRLIVGSAVRRQDDEPARRVANLFAQAGLDAPVVPSIQAEVWSKLWGNMTMNPASMLTMQTTDRILADADVRDYLSRAMLEAGAVGERIGIPMPMTPEQRHAVAGQLGAFKTSMLQDFEAGRMVELDALVGAVIEIADRVRVNVPFIRSLMGLARLRAAAAGLYASSGLR